MASLGEYTEQQSRFYLSFSRGGTCCSDTCEACGRTYFITSQGHGDYNEGELESLREKAAAEPDKYIEVPDFSSVSSAQLGSQRVIVGCLCDPTKRYSDWIENHAEELARYLTLYWQSKRDEAMREATKANGQLSQIEALDKMRQVIEIMGETSQS